VRRGAPISLAMPAFMAMVVASLAAWIAESAIRSVAGTFTSLFLGLVVGTVSFYFARRLFGELRGGL